MQMRLTMQQTANNYRASHKRTLFLVNARIISRWITICPDKTWINISETKYYYFH